MRAREDEKRMISGTHAANERRDEGNACLSASDGLAEAEQKRQVAVNAIITFELARGLNTLPG